MDLLYLFCGYEGGVAYEIAATDSKKFLNEDTSTIPIIPTLKADSSLNGVGGGGTTNCDVKVL